MKKKIQVILRFAKYLALILAVIFPLAVLTEFFTQPGALLTLGFWLEVIIDLLPGLLAVALAWWLAGRLARQLYETGRLGTGIVLLRRRRFGKIGMSPFALLSQGKVLADVHHVVTRGGPASLVIHNDTAVVLEKAGRLTRVEGPGFPALEPFEKVYDIIDLRPKTWNYTVNALTKEGLPVSWEVEVHYKINDDGVTPTDKAPYPFVKADVFRAATSKWRREKTRTQDIDWEGRLVVGQAEGTLRSILARRCLDELIGLSEADRLAVREAIQEELAEILRQAAPQVGAKILEVRLNNLKVDDEITNQWIGNWRTRWQTWSTNQLAEEEAESIKVAEMAKAEAQIMPLNLLTKELQELESGQDINTIISMRLIAALAQSRFENEVFAPNEALDTLRKFQDLLDGGADKTADLPPQLAASTYSQEPPNRTLPLLGEISAGQAMSASDDIIGRVQQTGAMEFTLNGRPLAVKKLFKGSHLKFDPEYNYVVLPVAGDSMNLAGIDRGNYVILQTAHLSPVRPAAGDVVAVSFRDPADSTQATLKRIYFEGSQVVLQPESSNPAHEPRVLSKSAFAGDNPQAKVVGVVVAVLG